MRAGEQSEQEAQPFQLDYLGTSCNNWIRIPEPNLVML